MIDSPLLMTALYRCATYAILPALPFYMKKRLKKGKEERERMKEKYGYTSIQRPFPKNTENKLIWLHAASVGELVSSISLIKHFEEKHPHIHFLVTSGTVTSAKIAHQRLGKNATHQFAPLDIPHFIRRFLDHWEPDLVLWLESELWPNQLHAIKSRQVPAILLNARLSNKSFDKWKKYPSIMQNLLTAFQQISVQSPEDRLKFSRLAKGRDILFPGNLKMASDPLVFNLEEGNKLRELIAKRPIIVAASTHKGEEEIIIAAHIQYTKYENDHHLNPLTIIVPRHPERGAQVAELLVEKNCVFAQRSKKQLPDENTEIYLADSLGELGLFYSLADIVIIGGSFGEKIGGHNPVEPALLNCAILHGPDMDNFQSMKNALNEYNAAIMIDNKYELGENILSLLNDNQQQDKLKKNSFDWSNGQRDQIIRHVEKLILTQMNLSDTMPAKTVLQSAEARNESS